MSLLIDLEKVECTDPQIFSNVKFMLDGTIDSKIPSLLQAGGATKKLFAGVSTTHFIAGPDADEMKADEAKEVFEIPVVVPDWVALSLVQGKLLPTDGFEFHHKKLFSSVVVCTSGIKGKDLHSVWAMITYYGGQFRKSLTTKCTHLINHTCTGAAYLKAKDIGLKIVCCDWVVECVKNDFLIEESAFDPALLVTNQVTAPSPFPGARVNVNAQNQIMSHQNSQPQVVNHNTTGMSQEMRPVAPNPHQQQFMQLQPTQVVQNQQQHQGRFPSQTQAQQQKGHFPVSQPQQAQNRPQAMMGQMQQHRSQFQLMQQQTPQQQPPQQQTTSTQQMYRQLPPQGQMQMYNPIQQQRLQSPPSTPQQQQVPSPRLNQVPSPHLNQVPSPHLNQVPSPHLNQVPSPHLNQSQMMQVQSQPQQTQTQQRGQFQPMQQQAPQQQPPQQQSTGTQQMYRQLPPQGQMQMYHPIQQQCIQSPPSTSQQQQVPATHLNQSQMMQVQAQPQQTQTQQRGQFQPMQQQAPQQQSTGTQQMYRQLPPQGQMQMYHPIQQQCIQSPPSTPQQQQVPSPQFNQCQMMQVQAQPQQTQQQHRGQFQPMQQQTPQQTQAQHQGHFQVSQPQQAQNRPQSMMGPMQQHRAQFQQPAQQQALQQQSTGAQQMYRQLQPQGQMQMYHPIQQQCLQSPPSTSQQQQVTSPHLNQSQMMQVQAQPQQTQPQRCNVVETHPQQQFQIQTLSPQHQQQQQQNPQQPGLQQQRIQFQQRPPVLQWTQQQQMEIVQQIQRDPAIRAQWSRMDAAQKQLLMQKLAQRKREEVLREMLLRQQHMNNQSAQQQSPNVPQQQAISDPQQVPMSPNEGLCNTQQVQKSPNQQMSPNSSQKFLAPAPIVQTRPQTHGVIGTPQQNSQPTPGVVRTQQIFTPQVGQQQQVRIHHVLIQPGQQRPPTLQQQIANQKMPIMVQSPSSQWHPSQQQRMINSGNQNPFPTRLPSTPDEPSSSTSPAGAQWSIRPQTQSPQSPAPQPNVSYVQVVNSKTKTALANLLSNRLQGNSGPESNITSSVSSPLTSTASTTQALCPPHSPQLTSQSPPHASPTTTQSNVLVQRRTLANLTNGCKTIQVNSFGAARVATSQPSPVATIRPKFFGHDPQATIPYNLFLVGCVFWVQDSVAMVDNTWKPLIIYKGGSVVDEYGQTVTHILSETHTFPEFSQAIRDGKRIITSEWLRYVCRSKTMSPPTQALHLPMHFSKDNPPLLDHVVSTTNFSREDRKNLRILLQILGAKRIDYFSRFATILVCNKPEGAKYRKAREWKIPVVNVHFLNELYLGHMSALQMIHSPKYQCFNPDQPLRLEYTAAPHLMAGWKIPIRVTSEIIEISETRKRAAMDEIRSDPAKRARFMTEDKSFDTEKSEVSDDEPLSPSEMQISSETEQSPPLATTSSIDFNVLKVNNEDAENQRLVPSDEPLSVREITNDKVELPEDHNTQSPGTSESFAVMSIDLKSKVVVEVPCASDKNALSPNGHPNLPSFGMLPPVVLISGFTRSHKERMTEKIKKLGGKFTTEWNEATHLILKQGYLTTKLFLGICRLRYIVSSDWLLQSVTTGRFVDEKPYIIRSERFETHFNTTVADALSKPNRHALFKGVTFFFTPGNWALKRDVEIIIEAAGGTVDRTSKSLRHIRDYCSKFPKRSVLVTSHEDFGLMYDFLADARRPHLINVYTDDFIWKCVATQTIQLRQTQS